MSTKLKRWTEEDKNIVKRDYPEYGAQYLSILLSRSKTAILSLVSKMGLVLSERGRREAYLLASKNAKFKFKVEECKKMNDPHIIYSLGFLWADGSIRNGNKYPSRLSFCNKKEDINEITNSLNHIANWSLKIYKARPDTINGICGGKLAMEYLVELGFLEKSWNGPIKLLNLIPEHLRHYWWRGYLDGDGNIGKHRYSVVFSSCHEQDWSFCKILPLDIFPKIYFSKNKNGRDSRWILIKRADVLAFLEYVYQGREEDQIGLIRKYNIYKEKYIVEDIKYKNPNNRGIYKKREKTKSYSFKRNANRETPLLKEQQFEMTQERDAAQKV